MLSTMVDIEALSTKTNATILSIGAVFFDDTALDTPEQLVRAGFHVLVDYQGGQRHIDPDTVVWWSKQSHEAILDVFNPNDRIPLTDALSQLYSFSRRAKAFWSHGVTFDLMVLQDAYNQCGLKTPWHYRDMRDTRTLFSLVSQSTLNGIWPDNPKKHNALYDAAVQAVVVQRVMAELKKG